MFSLAPVIAVPAWRRVVRGIAVLVGAALCLYLAGLVALWWGQEGLLFQPQQLPPAYRFAVGADVEERFVDVPGARLNALHLKLPSPRGVVFFLHGNGGSLRNWFVDIDFFRRANYDLFMIDYRGYGKSTGRIESEAQLQSDVRAAWDAVAPAYEARRRVVFGRSLGTALAADLATRVKPELTILVSPYTSMRELAGEVYPWVPGAVLRYPLRTDAALDRVDTPVLLVHGERDTLIAPSHSQALQQRHPAAQLDIVPGAGHNDLQAFDAYLDALRRALDAL